MDWEIDNARFVHIHKIKTMRAAHLTFRRRWLDSDSSLASWVCFAHSNLEFCNNFVKFRNMSWKSDWSCSDSEFSSQKWTLINIRLQIRINLLNLKILISIRTVLRSGFRQYREIQDLINMIWVTRILLKRCSRLSERYRNVRDTANLSPCRPSSSCST
jgi:hypothetical protein